MRTVVQDREVTQDIEAAKKSYRLVEGAIQGLEWLLARNPKEGIHRTGKYWLYNQAGVKIHRIPEITVLYSFTDDEVTLHAIMFRPGS